MRGAASAHGGSRLSAADTTSCTTRSSTSPEAVRPLAVGDVARGDSSVATTSGHSSTRLAWLRGTARSAKGGRSAPGVAVTPPDTLRVWRGGRMAAASSPSLCSASRSRPATVTQSSSGPHGNRSDAEVVVPPQPRRRSSTPQAGSGLGHGRQAGLAFSTEALVSVALGIPVYTAV